MPGFKIQVVDVDENAVESNRIDVDSDMKFATKYEALKALRAERSGLMTGEKPLDASEIEEMLEILTSVLSRGSER